MEKGKGIEMLNIKTLSDSECLKADVFVAGTKKEFDRRMIEGGVYVKGTKGGYFCCLCNEEVVLAPSGQRLEAMGAKYTCILCVEKLIASEN